MCARPPCREHAAEVWDMLYTQNGSLYVCGATTMGKDVDAAIASIAAELGGMSEADVKRWREARRDQYVVELW